MTTKSVFALALEAGIKPFDRPEDSLKPAADLAASLLEGRNPYFHPEYRKKYNLRVHALEASTQRLVLGVVESAAMHGEKDRRYRAVLFRCDGEVLYQTPDNRVLDMNAAVIDMRYYMQHQDETQILAAMCIQQVRIAARMRDAAERIMGILHKQGP